MKMIKLYFIIFLFIPFTVSSELLEKERRVSIVEIPIEAKQANGSDNLSSNNKSQVKYIPTLEKLKKALDKYHETAPEGERIVDSASWNLYYRRIPGAPPLPYIYYEEWVSWEDLLGQEKFSDMSEEEISILVGNTLKFLLALQEHNDRVPWGERIYDEQTLNKFGEHIPDPPAQLFLMKDKLFLLKLQYAINGYNETVSRKLRFVFVDIPDKIPAYKLYSNIRKHNRQSPYYKQIYDRESYEKFYIDVYGAPADPIGYYNDSHFFENLKSMYVSYSHFLYQLNYHNENASFDNQITDHESFDRLSAMFLDEQVPPYPLQFYNKEEIVFDKGVLRVEFFKTVEELQEALVVHNETHPEQRITIPKSYKAFSYLIRGAPKFPVIYYQKTWKEILSVVKVKKDKFFKTVEELQEALVAHNINNPNERIDSRGSYEAFSYLIPGAPPKPDVRYKKKWSEILSVVKVEFFKTLEELIEAVVVYNTNNPDDPINSRELYKDLRYLIPGAYSNPNIYYKNKGWKGWSEFFKQVNGRCAQVFQEAS